MNFLIAILIMLGAAQSYAIPPRWNKIIECNYGELVVDQATIYLDPRPIYQFVLRGQPLMYFVRSGAIDKKHVNNKGEFILTIYSSGYGEFSGNIYYGNKPSGSYIFRNYKLKRNFDEVTLRAFEDTYPDAKEMVNWAFRGCRHQSFQQ